MTCMHTELFMYIYINKKDIRAFRNDTLAVLLTIDSPR